MVAATLTAGFMDIARQGEEFYGRAASIDPPKDGYTTDMAAYSLMDAIVSRVMPSLHVEEQPATPEDSITKAHQNLQQAWTKAETFRKETPKINNYQQMTASGQGLARSGEQIQNKEGAVQELKSAMIELQNVQKVSAETMPGGGNNLVKDAAVSTAAGITAEAILPGVGGMAAAAFGLGSMGAKLTKSAFSSPSDEDQGSVYQTAPAPEPMSMGAQINQAMAQGPGFGHLPAQIELMTEPSLEDMSCLFSEAQIAALAIEMDRMEHDVTLGKTMYNRHLESMIPVTEKVMNVPPDSLKVSSPEDEIKLASGQPDLYQDALKKAFITPGGTAL